MRQTDARRTPLIEFLHPDNRQEALVICAGVALHGLLAGGVGATYPAKDTVDVAFQIAAEFLRQAEAVK